MFYAWFKSHSPRGTRRVAFVPFKSVWTVSLVLSFHVFAQAQVAHAQVRTESVVGKCAALNLAHFYLKCFSIVDAQVHFMKKDTEMSRLPKKDRETIKAYEHLKSDYALVASNLYKLAGHDFHGKVLVERHALNNPEAQAAIREWFERGALTALGKRKPAAPNMLDQCSRNELGQEIRETDKMDARFKVYVQRANELLLKQPSCLE